jgi:RNA polymerase sigma-70 factor (ECF subfamily)
VDDRELLIRLQNHETDALEIAMKKYTGYVATIIYNKGQKRFAPMDVEEMTSDVFISLWEHAQSISSGRLKGWLSRVARNKAVDRLRQQQITLPLEDQPLAIADDLWEQMADAEKHDMIEQALGQLEPSLRELFYRYYILGETSQEIGHRMGIHPVTVRTRLLHGREKLRHILIEGGYFREDES